MPMNPNDAMTALQRLMERKKWYDAVTRPFGNLDICIGIAKISFLTSDIFFKAPQYSLLRLVVQHQHHFATSSHSLPFPLHPSRSIHWCSKKHAVWLFRSTSQNISSKTCFPKTFVQNIYGGVHFKYLYSFLEVFQQAI